MKRVALETNHNPHFIGSWNIESAALCQSLIDLFESQERLHAHGKTAGGLNSESKRSMDLAIRPRDIEQAAYRPVRDYMDLLFDCYTDYLAQWPFLASFLSRADIGPFNIQRYDPGGHFIKLHSERTRLSTAQRVLAWMTYLNDVDDGGATYFEHQNLEIKPEQGKTLIWPAEWTHAHRGNTVGSGRKYIITGWLHFPAP